MSMFGLFKKEDESEISPQEFMQLMADLKFTSMYLQLELAQNKIRWSDDKIQFFIPLILHYTDFEWLDLIAKQNCNKDYQVIHNFLEHVQNLMKVNEQKFEEVKS